MPANTSGPTTSLAKVSARTYRSRSWKRFCSPGEGRFCHRASVLHWGLYLAKLRRVHGRSIRLIGVAVGFFSEAEISFRLLRSFTAPCTVDFDNPVPSDISWWLNDATS